MRLITHAPLWLFLPRMLAGCGFTGLRDRHDDNPHIRVLQEANIAKFGERPVAGLGIDEFFRDKVGLVTVEGGDIPIGRATPLSRDGYYITAWHVVDDGKFRLSDTISSGDNIRVREYPGRVVWHDEAADLAIVKFEYRPAYQFEPRIHPPEKGAAVFSGASGLNGGRLIVPRNDSGTYDLATVLTSGVGNGRFRTAGRVTSVEILSTGIPRLVYESTLVGRGGMSGAPVVDDRGNLVGVVTGGRVKLFAGTMTTFSMLDPKTLEATIDADRSRKAPRY